MAPTKFGLSILLVQPLIEKGEKKGRKREGKSIPRDTGSMNLSTLFFFKGKKGKGEKKRKKKEERSKKKGG